VRVAALAGGAMWLWYLVPTGLLTARGWWLVGGFLSVLVLLFSRRLLTLSTKIHGSVEGVLEGPPTPAVPSRWEQQSQDWGLNLQEIELPSGAVCAGRTIAALAIRRRYGCTIVEINRQGYVLAGPEPSLALFPGDTLLVLGAAERLAELRAELTRQGQSDEEVAGFEDARLETLTVPANPEIEGQPLRELRIPHRTGAVVVGIAHEGRKHANPSGDEVVNAGDEWLVIGAADELRALKALLVHEEVPASGSV